MKRRVTSICWEVVGHESRACGKPKKRELTATAILTSRFTLGQHELIPEKVSIHKDIALVSAAWLGLIHLEGR